MIYELSFRGKSGAVYPGRLTAYGSMNHVVSPGQELVNYEQVTFLVHGFNVEDEEGRVSLSTLANLLAVHIKGAIVFVLWPGDSPVGPLSYPFTEGLQAIDTAVQLKRRIQEHVAPSTKLNFIGHSLGCRVVLETIRNLYVDSRSAHGDYPVNQVCLMAGAVDDYCLSIPEVYKSSVEHAERIVVLSSTEDKVLKYIYPLGDLVQSFIYFWKESFGLALGYHGPKDYTEEWDPFDEDAEAKTSVIADNVRNISIEPGHKVNHGDYLPPDKQGAAMNDKQKKAARLASAVIGGVSDVKYT